MSPTADDGALIITFPRAWTSAQRLEFMADVARALPHERWAHVGELHGQLDATASERRAVFERLTGRRALGKLEYSHSIGMLTMLSIVSSASLALNMVTGPHDHHHSDG